MIKFWLFSIFLIFFFKLIEAQLILTQQEPLESNVCTAECVVGLAENGLLECLPKDKCYQQNKAKEIEKDQEQVKEEDQEKLLPPSPGFPECGNGIVEDGEECDPPGAKEEIICGSGACKGTSYRVCNANCKWSGWSKCSSDNNPCSVKVRCRGRDLRCVDNSLCTKIKNKAVISSKCFAGSCLKPSKDEIFNACYECKECGIGLICKGNACIPSEKSCQRNEDCLPGYCCLAEIGLGNACVKAGYVSQKYLCK